MVELCVGRVNIIHLDEETLLEEAKNINMEKIRLSIKQVNYPKIKYYILLILKKNQQILIMNT